MRFLLAVLIATAAPGAQTPESSFVHAVAYVNVKPDAASAAIAAFRQYRQASRAENGFIDLELFQQEGNPGRLAVLETWANQAAFEAHGAAAHTKVWRGKIDGIRISYYDQRPYKSLTLSSPRSSQAAGNAVYVITHVDIGGPGANASELLRQHAEASRKDGGNLRFDVLQHAMRGNHFTVIEAWQSRKALDAHFAGSQTRQYLETLGPSTGSPLDERIYKAAP